MLSNKKISSFYTTIALITLAAIYYYWSISGELGLFGGDNAYYLLMAQSFSPWNEPSSVAIFFARQNPYPPLYPFTLGLFGGQNNLYIAHFVTTSFLLLTLLIYYAWQRRIGISTAAAACATGLFALLPGTYMQALELLSENLYLFLTLSCLLAATRYEQDKRDAWLWVAAISTAGATLTRSVGISLLAALIIYLVRKKPPKAWRYALLAGTPMLLWALLAPHDSPGYLIDFLRTYSADPVRILWIQLFTQPPSLWHGWLANFTTTPIGVWVVAPLTLLGLAGLLYRLASGCLDGYYVILYFALVLIWPYPAEAARLVYVIQPIVLIQALMFLGRYPFHYRTHERRIHLGAMVMAAIFIVALPNLALTLQRFLQPLPLGLENMRRSPYWYGPKFSQVLLDIRHIHVLSEHMESIREQVPVTECIYSIKPSIVGLYTQRRVFAPLPSTASDEEFKAMLNSGPCHYFFVVNETSPSYPERLYPLKRIGNMGKVISVARLSKDSDPISELIETYPF
ncbi:MAG: ArnT family glycosyltransferase [Sulfuricaulis sp.]